MEAYIGLDPSIVGTGMALYFPVPHKFVVHQFPKLPGRVTDFEFAYKAALFQMATMKDLFEHYAIRKAVVIQEAPPPIGLYAPGLFSIGTALRIFFDLRDIPVVTVHATRLKQLTGLGKFYEKSRVPPLAMEIIMLNSWINPLDHATKATIKKLKSDQADAFILLTYLLYNHSFVVKLPNNLDVNTWLLKEEWCSNGNESKRSQGLNALI